VARAALGAACKCQQLRTRCGDTCEPAGRRPVKEHLHSEYTDIVRLRTITSARVFQRRATCFSRAVSLGRLLSPNASSTRVSAAGTDDACSPSVPSVCARWPRRRSVLVMRRTSRASDSASSPWFSSHHCAMAMLARSSADASASPKYSLSCSPNTAAPAQSASPAWQCRSTMRFGVHAPGAPETTRRRTSSSTWTSAAYRGASCVATYQAGPRLPGRFSARYSARGCARPQSLPRAVRSASRIWSASRRSCGVLHPAWRQREAGGGRGGVRGTHL